MAIAFGAFSDGLFLASAASATLAHTQVAGANGLGIVAVFETDGSTTTNHVTGVTWNGSAMTKITDTPFTGVSGRESLWYIALGTMSAGSVNIVASYSPNVASRLRAASYTGCSQTGIPDSSNTSAVATSTSMTITTTVVAANCWLVGSGKANNTFQTAGAGTTVRSVASDDTTYFDSNGTVSTGSRSLIVTGTNTQHTGTIASIAPVAAAGSTVTLGTTRLLTGVGT